MEACITHLRFHRISFHQASCQKRAEITTRISRWNRGSSSDIGQAVSSLPWCGPGQRSPSKQRLRGRPDFPSGSTAGSQPSASSLHQREPRDSSPGGSSAPQWPTPLGERGTGCASCAARCSAAAPACRRTPVGQPTRGTATGWRCCATALRSGGQRRGAGSRRAAAQNRTPKVEHHLGFEDSAGAGAEGRGKLIW